MTTLVRLSNCLQATSRGQSHSSTVMGELHEDPWKLAHESIQRLRELTATPPRNHPRSLFNDTTPPQVTYRRY